MSEQEKRIARLEYAVDTMASWLVMAGTGFGRQDAQGIWQILRGERDDEIPALSTARGKAKP